MDRSSSHNFYCVRIAPVGTSTERLTGWSSVDRDGTEPHIGAKGATGIVRGRRVDGTTKTGRIRRISIDPGTVTALRAHAERQAEERKKVGAGWPDSDRVFRMEMGGPLRTDWPGEFMRQRIRAINKAKGTEALLPIRLHDLRHVHATLLLQAGCPCTS